MHKQGKCKVDLIVKTGWRDQRDMKLISVLIPQSLENKKGQSDDNRVTFDSAGKQKWCETQTEQHLSLLL